jgi:hypothetical protein
VGDALPDGASLVEAAEAFLRGERFDAASGERIQERPRTHFLQRVAQWASRVRSGHRTASDPAGQASTAIVPSDEEHVS